MAKLNTVKQWKRLERKLIHEIREADNDDNVAELIQSVAVHLAEGKIVRIRQTLAREVRRRKRAEGTPSEPGVSPE
jgi:hypothetical protein